MPGASALGKRTIATNPSAAAGQTAGNTIVLFGNSRVARELGSPSLSSSVLGMFTWANAKAGSRFKVVNYAGISGQTQPQFIARFATDVAAYRPAWVLLCDAINDVGAGRTTAQMIADTQTLIAMCKSIGARVLLLTAAPYTSHTTAQRAILDAWNVWVKSISDPVVYPIDVAAAVTDPATGSYITAYADGDGLHQSPQGASRMARIITNTITQLVPPREPFQDALDTTNAILNPGIAGTAGAGFPTNWTTVGTATFSTAARTDHIPGNWLQIDTTAAAGDCFARQGFKTIPATAFAPGDTVQLFVEVQIVSVTALTQMQFQATLADAGNVTLGAVYAFRKTNVGPYYLPDLPAPGETWVFASPPTVVPAGTVTYNLTDEWNGQGVVRFGRHRLAKVS